jgi:hypothetical protein
MGLFGGKKIYVSSTVYNLAGDEDLRPNFLKTSVIGTVVGGTQGRSISEDLQTNYLHGPGIKLRSYYHWATNPTGDFQSVMSFWSQGLAAAPTIDPTVLAAAVPHASGETVALQSTRYDLADFEIWAEQWMLANHPADFAGAWLCDFNETTGVITVTLPDASTHSFTPAGFDKTKLYIYATYNKVTGSVSGSITTGSTATTAFPSTSGWTTDSFTSTTHSDLGGWTETHGVYERTTYQGDDGTGRIWSLREIMYQDQSAHDDGAGHAVIDHSWRVDTQEITYKTWSPLAVFIYPIGSGNSALDAQVEVLDNVFGFFPPIPVRLDNHFVYSDYHSEIYEQSKKAYKKLTNGGKFQTLLDKIQANDHLSDLDYVHIVPGVSLNVKENACRKYLYNFFHNSMLTALYGASDYTTWQGEKSSATSSITNFAGWSQDQLNPAAPDYGAADPLRLSYPNAPLNEVSIHSDNPLLSFQMRVQWQSISETIGSGLAKPGAKTGEVWLDKASSADETGPVYVNHVLGLVGAPDSQADDVLITWQVSQTEWRRLSVRGLVHKNYAYGGHIVETKAHEALDDVDESGFIVPLHYPTLVQMSLVDQTQMSTACLFLVFNSYKVVKTRWYQTGFFRMILVIAIIIIVAYTQQYELLSTTGLLGTGITLGLSGFALFLANVAINAITAMIIMKLIATVSVAIFGEKFGMVIAILADFIVLDLGKALEDGATMAQAFSQLANPVVLLHLTEAIGNAASAYIHGMINGVIQETEQVTDRFKQAQSDISDLYAQNIGYDRGIFDPMSLVDAGQPFIETPNTFLTRTLMTGTDIAELSLSLISNFADLTLAPLLPLT